MELCGFRVCDGGGRELGEAQRRRAYLDQRLVQMIANLRKINTQRPRYDLDRDGRSRESVPLTGWKLLLSWMVLFSLGWVAALAFFGAIHWLLDVLAP